MQLNDIVVDTTVVNIIYMYRIKSISFSLIAIVGNDLHFSQIVVVLVDGMLSERSVHWPCVIASEV